MPVGNLLRIRRNSSPLGAGTGCKVALTVTAVALLVAVSVLQPVWQRLSPPFVMPLSSPRVAAPVDGPFYIRNGTEGYRWTTDAPESLWFHPLLSLVIRIVPQQLPSDLAFWLISVAFSFGAVILLLRLGKHLLPSVRWDSRTGVAFLLCPGMLFLGVGNPEVPTLFFSTLLMVLLIENRSAWSIAGIASLAVLTKPTALALAPGLLVYALYAWRNRDRQLLRAALVACSAMVGAWLGWAAFVGWQSHDFGAYWEARASFSQYVPGSLSNFFGYASGALSGHRGTRDFVRFGSALAVPVVSLFVVAASRSRERVHATAHFVSVCAILFFVVWTGNPNKVFAYLITLPGQVLFHAELLAGAPDYGCLARFGRSAYIAYALVMGVVFVVGTPLGWYY